MTARPKLQKKFLNPAFLLLLLASASASMGAQYLGSLPRSLAGSWRITRMLPTTNSSCWTRQQAQQLLGSTLIYRSTSMRWRGGAIPVTDVSLRDLSNREFQEENSGPQTPADFAQLGIRASTVTEVDLQHDDADILPASTAVPGDSVLLAAPNRIIVNACGVYFEAVRAGETRVSTAR